LLAWAAWAVLLLPGLVPPVLVQPAFAQSWVLHRQESFDADGTLADGERLGEQDWLIARIRNAGSITLTGGVARFATPDFPDSALLRVFERLPAEYRIRVRVGMVDYGYELYEPADYQDPDFKYNRVGTTSQWVENGFYWLTLTDRLVEPDSGEDWWHRYRKVVIDSDDHLNGSGSVHTERPLYMVYMNPDLDRESGDWTSGQANLLRSWSGGVWHTGTWNWEVAFQYSVAAWYVVEIEKSDGELQLRVYDDAMTPIELADPVALDLIYGMGVQAAAQEYAYVGEPHVDSYEGTAEVDEILLWVNALIDSDSDGLADPADNCLVDANGGQADRDADGQGDACDVDDGALHLSLAAGAGLRWDRETGHESWNVYRGDLDQLRATGIYTPLPGSDPVAARFCGLSLPQFDDAFAPVAGVTAYYLISGVSAGVEGGLGEDGEGLPRTNLNPCP
jgi:hypothetical protein